MKTALIVLVSSIISVAATVLVFWFLDRPSELPQALQDVIQPTPVPTPLAKYTFENIARRQPEISPIEVGRVLEEGDTFTSYLFTYQTEGKTISGQVNLPDGYENKRNPTIIMLRGFVPPSAFVTGTGTRPSARVYARNGFVTFAPDFFGFGESDPPNEDVFGERFQKPLNVIDLIESVKQLEYVDPENIFIWGHSNGGQIALSVLEITREPYPTTLWAPVSKPFPYSILVYTDEYEDLGFDLRRTLAEFERLYDVNEFSIGAYMDRINAPIQVHQGGLDPEVLISWSDDLVRTLESYEGREENPNLEVTYYRYPGSDHQLSQNWDTVVERDLEFFRSHLE